MSTAATPRPLYRRILLKLSGEALMGSGGYGVDPASAARYARDIVAAKALGAQVAVVIGGGNIFRGVAAAARGMDRATGDYMGMLATVMNALALQGALEQEEAPARVLSAIAMPPVCETYLRPRALRHLEKERIVIFAAGTGNPFFTTDTAAALRAAEMQCDVIIKGTQVDGVYSADPKTNPSADRYDRLSYDDVLSRNLKVMDAAAIALARDNGIPIVVFAVREERSLVRLLKGEGKSTTISA